MKFFLANKDYWSYFPNSSPEGDYVSVQNRQRSFVSPVVFLCTIVILVSPTSFLIRVEIFQRKGVNDLGVNATNSSGGNGLVLCSSIKYVALEPEESRKS